MNNRPMTFFIDTCYTNNQAEAWTPNILWIEEFILNDYLAIQNVD